MKGYPYTDNPEDHVKMPVTVQKITGILCDKGDDKDIGQRCVDFLFLQKITDFQARFLTVVSIDSHGRTARSF